MTSSENGMTMKMENEIVGAYVDSRLGLHLSEAELAQATRCTKGDFCLGKPLQICAIFCYKTLIRFESFPSAVIYDCLRKFLSSTECKNIANVAKILKNVTSQFYHFELAFLKT